MKQFFLGSFLATHLRKKARLVARMSVGHWDYFASLGVRGAAVGSERREEGQGISRHLTSASLGKDDLKMGGKDVMICSSVAVRFVDFLC